MPSSRSLFIDGRHKHGDDASANATLPGVMRWMCTLPTTKQLLNQFTNSLLIIPHTSVRVYGHLLPTDKLYRLSRFPALYLIDGRSEPSSWDRIWLLVCLSVTMRLSLLIPHGGLMLTRLFIAPVSAVHEPLGLLGEDTNPPPLLDST